MQAINQYNQGGQLIWTIDAILKDEKERNIQTLIWSEYIHIENKTSRDYQKYKTNEDNQKCDISTHLSDFEKKQREDNSRAVLRDN